MKFTTALLLCLVSECAAATRYFNFTVEHTLLMQYGQYQAYAKDGILYYHNDSANSGSPGIEMKVPDADVPKITTGDGFYRTAPTVNGIIPGPAIVVDEGDEVVVTVMNALENDAVTIHWHGMYQRGTNYMDGVSQITQCPTLPGQSFEYRFIAEPAGTHFWHAHHGILRSDGLFGPLIVMPKTPPPKPEITLPMTVNLWYHTSTSDLYHKRLGPGWFPEGARTGIPFKWERTVSGKLATEMPFKSLMVNGKARFNNSQIALSTYTVDPAGNYRFRIVNSGLANPVKVSIDQHELIILATDGVDVKPELVESVIIQPGETYDMTVNLNQSPDLYWIRVETLLTNEGVTHSGFAILRYSNVIGRVGEDPKTVPRNCTADNVCKTLNCPFPAYSKASNRVCMSVHLLTGLAPKSTVPVDQEVFLNYGFSPLAVNNRRFVEPKAPPLSQPLEADMIPCDDSCDTVPCSCTHMQTFPYNKRIQMVVSNIGPHGYGMHPMHMHGHHFEVVHIGYPPYNETTGHVCEWPAGTPHPSCLQNMDIDCKEGTACAVESWANGVPPNFTNPNPPHKDTVIIPAGGYAVIRFTTDNPGLWHMHCHMAHHAWYGLGLVINEAPEMQSKFPVPNNFPKCGSFHSTSSAQDAHKIWESLKNL
eukprot:TRINITY_DN1239_c0_g1_i2.p1 TRINITY_DN1239_c0_g1~~TRINITY_DN1239_c0_g1_i2.p1  ORF type:complete len:648 (+),score=118.20 TRINITY_DN1239_c0_g1_i2:76-2019(+)